MYGALLQLFAAPNIVFPENIAAIDNNVTRCKQLSELADGIFGNLTGREHEPNRARRLQLFDKFVEARGANPEATLKRFYREQDRIRLQPANSQMKPIYVDPEHIRIQGKVVAVLRKL